MIKLVCVCPKPLPHTPPRLPDASCPLWNWQQPRRAGRGHSEVHVRLSCYRVAVSVHTELQAAAKYRGLQAEGEDLCKGKAELSQMAAAGSKQDIGSSQEAR